MNSGKSNRDYGLPVPHLLQGHFRELPHYINATSPDDLPVQQHRELAQQQRESMNADQAAAFDLITQALHNTNPRDAKCYFVDGPGGTGKTFLFKVSLTQNNPISERKISKSLFLLSHFSIMLAVMACRSFRWRTLALQLRSCLAV